MNKVVVAALVVVGGTGAGITGTSAWMGRTVVARLSQQTAAVTKMIPSAKIEEEIDHGLFKSTRKVKVRFGCAPVPGPDQSLELAPLELSWRDEIQHGPFPGAKSFGAAVIDSELRLGDAWAKRAGQALGDQPVLSAHTRIGMDGAFSSELTVPKLAFKDKNDNTGEWSGIKAHVTGQFPTGAGTLSYVTSVEPFHLVVHAVGGSFSLSVGETHTSASAQLDPKATSSFPFPYKSEGQIASIELKAVPPPGVTPSDKPMQLTMSKLTMKADSSLDKELWSTSTRFGGSLNINGLAIDKVEMASAFRRVHAPTYTKLIGQVLQSALSCDATQAHDPLANAAAMEKDFFTFLTHDPELSMGPMAIELAGKRAEISYTAGVRGVTPSDASTPLILLLPMKAVAHAEARAHLGLIDEFAKLAANAMPDLAPGGAGSGQAALMARTMIDGFVQQGYLVRDGETIRATFDSAGGAFLLNGKPFALPNMAAVAGP